MILTDASDADPVRTTLSWEDRAWLHHYPLNRDTVLDYFSNSQARGPSAARTFHRPAARTAAAAKLRCADPVARSSTIGRA